MSFGFVLESVINGLLLGGIFALLGVGFSLNWGTMSVLNMSHGAFAVLGAFIAYWLFTKTGVDPILSLPIVAALLFFIGGITYRLVIRRVLIARDVVMGSLVATFGIVYMLVNFMSYIWQPDPRVLKPGYTGASIFIGDIIVPQGRLIGFVMAVIGIAILYIFLHHTFTGKAVQATWQDPGGAVLVGINPDRVSLITFGLSLASAGVAGVAMAFIYAFYPAVEGIWMIYVFLVTIIGGVGSLLGAAFSGLIIGFIVGLSAAFLPFIWVNILLFVLLLIIVLFKPEGLFTN
jgi:branched-chain amino acid transport system permease protein